MGFNKVKQSTLIGIALLISALINLPRVLRLFDVVDNFSQAFTPASLKDVIIRSLFLFIFSWFILQFNTNWKFIYTNYNKGIKTLITIVTNIILVFLTITIFIFVYEKLTDASMKLSDKRLLNFMFIIVLIILLFISRILRYQVIRQADITEKELLKQQSLENQLSALKNQINPHFLFNSLNSLNSLIRDNKQATTFVNELSYMYRYILQSGQQDVVTLKEELKFLDSYIYLIKTRYRDRFKVHIDIEDRWLHTHIPVLALQLLVENAVKHNEISESNPLQVTLYIEEDYLIVANIIKPRTTFVDSTGQGLANIDKRYVLLKEKHIIINNTDAIFKVKLPLK